MNLLILEDSDLDAQILFKELARSGLSIQMERTCDPDEYKVKLTMKPWDIILSDHNMPLFNSMEALAILKESGLDIPFVVLSGGLSQEATIQMMKAGAADVVDKRDTARLIPAIEREVKELGLRREKGRMEKDLREKNQQLQAAQKMEALGRLAAGVAHDFNNQLTILLTLADHIKRSPAADEDIKSMSDEMKEAAEKSAALTKQLLALGRQQVMEKRNSNLNDMVTDGEKMLRRIIGDDITIDLHLDPKIGLIHVDPNQIWQVLLNLAVNARDAMPKGGRLTFQTDMDAQRVHLAIKDNGEGIPPDVLPHIFEPFYTTKSKEKGTGLGLATVYGIVEQSGGAIRVESHVGQGTTFHLYFPMAASAEKPKSSPQPVNQAPLELKTVLVVEDDDAVRDAIDVVLTEKGCRVLEARNGGEALLIQEKEKNPIDMLITDLGLPLMNGLELMDRMRSKDPSLKVLFISGQAEPGPVPFKEVKKKASLLMKPFDQGQLVEKVREVLRF